MPRELLPGFSSSIAVPMRAAAPKRMIELLNYFN
jgi:hypothetical protein